MHELFEAPLPDILAFAAAQGIVLQDLVRVVGELIVRLDELEEQLVRREREC